MFNMNAKAMEKAMKQMGIQSEKIDASEVVIKTSDKDIVISNPDIMVIKMSGKQSFQISGDVTERTGGFSDDDVNMVAEQTGVTKDEARDALQQEGDIAKAILKLKA